MVLEEEYYLITKLNFSFFDVHYLLPIWKRKWFLRKYIKEQQKDENNEEARPTSQAAAKEMFMKKIQNAK